MSRSKHTLKELKAFKLLRDKFIKKIVKIDPNVKMMKEQVDKPDFGFILKNKKIGIEVCSVDSESLLKAIKDADSNKKLQQKRISAMKENKPLTIINETTKVEDIFNKILKKKFLLYSEYNKNFDEVILLLHTESYSDSRLYEILRVNLNKFCIKHKCKFNKVFLVDLKHYKYIGKVFDKKSPKKLRNTSPLASETRVMHFVPVGQPICMWDKYE